MKQFFTPRLTRFFSLLACGLLASTAIGQTAPSAISSQPVKQTASPAAGQVAQFEYDERDVAIGYYQNGELKPILPAVPMTQSTDRSSIVHMLSDADNFGYGGVDTPPCLYYDLSGAGDLGIFDREPNGGGDETETWSHNFTTDPGYGAGFIATDVLLEVREYFSDPFGYTTITIDGVVFPFVVNGTSTCNFPVVQTFHFTGAAAAAFANDGIVNIVFNENGDDIAYDWSKLTVIGSAVPECVPTPPANQTATTTPNTATVAWTVAANCVIDQSQIQHSRKSGASWLPWVSVAVPGAATTATITGLSANRTYRWRVRSHYVSNNAWIMSNPPYPTFVTPASLLGGGDEDDQKGGNSGILQLVATPNPASGSTTISLGMEDIENLDQVGQLRIHSFDGRLVFEKNGLSVVELENYELDLSSLNAGIYLLSVSTESGVAVQKLVVN